MATIEPSIRSTGKYRKASGSNIIVPIGEGTINGDLIVGFADLGTAVNTSNFTDKGWTVLTSETVNTRYFFIFVRKFLSTDDVANYTIVTPGGGAKVLTVTIKDHGVTSLPGDLLLGAPWERTTSIATSTALSITTTLAKSLALAMLGEATTASPTTFTQTTGDFTSVVESMEDNAATDGIETAVVFKKSMPTAGPTGNVVLTYASASLNGFGQQLVIPPGTVIEEPTDPTRVGFTTNRVAYAIGESSQNLPLPSGIQAGDRIILFVEWAGGIPAGLPSWSPLRSSNHGTRGYRIMDVGVYASGSTIALTHDATSAGNYTYGIVALRGIKAPSAWVIGSWWDRNGAGGGLTENLVLTKAPGLAAPANSLVLSFHGEATNSTEAAATSIAGATRWFESPAQTVNSVAIERVYVAYENVAAAKTTDQNVVTWPNSAQNGAAMQVAFPLLDAVIPTTGKVGIHAVVNPSQNIVSVGVDKLVGTVLEVILRNNADVELSRQIMTNDGTSGWGNCTFTSLTADTIYKIAFIVDGAEQTDAKITTKTMPAGVASYVFVAGSCQATGSNHQVWTRIKEENPLFLAHMGDLHYADTLDVATWRNAIESSMGSVRMQAALESMPISWTPDNHDRVLIDTLNLGTTDPATNSEFRKFAGSSAYPTVGNLGHTWVAGRVRYIQTDMWTLRDDPDLVSEPRTFLGAAQKQWLKDTLEAATEPLIIWFSQWTNRNNANGRWASFPSETLELETFFNARPALKRRMVMIGGDSHSLQADSGTWNAVRRASSSYRFKGIPSLNISGFDRAGGTTGDGGLAGEWDIANTGLAFGSTPSLEWGGYSRVQIDDDGQHLRFRWDAMRVDVNGNKNSMAFFERSFGSSYDQVFVNDVQASVVRVNDKPVWKATKFGTDERFSVFGSTTPTVTSYTDAPTDSWLATQFFIPEGSSYSAKVQGIRLLIPSGSAMIGKTGRIGLRRRALAAGGIFLGDTAIQENDFATNEAATVFATPLVAGWNDIYYSTEWDMLPGDGLVLAYLVDDGTHYLFNNDLSTAAINDVSGKGVQMAPSGSRSNYRGNWTTANWYGIDVLFRNA